MVKVSYLFLVFLSLELCKRNGGGKKGKKKKGKTLNLNEFLGGKDAPTVFIAPSRKVDWADEAEDGGGDVDIPEEYGGPPKALVDLAKLPSAPRSSRGADIDLSRLPSQPPYTAFLGNLPFDVTEDDIKQLFRGLRVENIRFPQDAGRMKGFGYAEFYDLEQLKAGLALTNEKIRTRPIRVDIADTSGRDGGQGREGGGKYGDRNTEQDDRTTDDWRNDMGGGGGGFGGGGGMGGGRMDDRRGGDRGGDRGGFRDERRGGDGPGRERRPEPSEADMDDVWRKDDRPPTQPSTNGWNNRGDRDNAWGGRRDDRGGGGFRDDRGGGGFRDDRGGGGFRDDRGGGGFRDDRGGGGFRDDRGGGGFRDDRGGGGFRDDRGGGGFRDDRGGGGFRDDRGGGGFRDDRGGGGFRDDRGGPRDDRGPPRRDDRSRSDDNSEGMWERGSAVVNRGPPAAETKADGPTERPKLNLKSRTETETKSTTPSTSSSIFGAARPVDTATKERQIEERLKTEMTRGRGDERGVPGRDSSRVSS